MSRLSSKSELAEAGRRKLEAFRKQKAAGTKAKKVATAEALPDNGKVLSQTREIPVIGSYGSYDGSQPVPSGSTAAAEPSTQTGVDNPQQSTSSSGPIPFQESRLPSDSGATSATLSIGQAPSNSNSRKQEAWQAGTGSLHNKSLPLWPANPMAELNENSEPGSANVPKPPGPCSQIKAKLLPPPPLTFKGPPPLPKATVSAPGRFPFPLPPPLRAAGPAKEASQKVDQKHLLQAPEPASPQNIPASVEHADSLAEELPISSPVPAYASLSDSYLFPGKDPSLTEDLAEEAGATLGSSSQQYAPDEMPLKTLTEAPSPAGASSAYAALSDSYLSPSPGQEVSAHSAGGLEREEASGAAEGQHEATSEAGTISSTDPNRAVSRTQPGVARSLDCWQPVTSSEAALGAPLRSHNLEVSHTRGFGSWSASASADAGGAAGVAEAENSSVQANSRGNHGSWPWTDRPAGSIQAPTSLLGPTAERTESHDQPDRIVGTERHLQDGSHGNSHASTSGTGKASENGSTNLGVPNGRSSFPWDLHRPISEQPRQSSLDISDEDDAAYEKQANGWPTDGKNGTKSKKAWVPNGLTSPPSFAHLLSDAPKKDADQFAALQQYIDDLTREKFEISRGLEQQRRVAETLAVENQSLTEDYNRQAQLVQELRREMEQRAAEIGAQQMALAGLGGERDACRSAVAEATQRAEALAAEVVSLEERVLQAKSEELRAAKQAEADSLAARRAAQMHASAAAECANLRTMVAALQEEKKKWPEQLRLASVGAPSKQHLLPASATGTASHKPESCASLEAEAGVSGSTASRPPQGAEISRLAAKARQHVAAQPSTSGTTPGDLPTGLAHLLPLRSYQGGASGEASEAVAEQRRVLGSIHSLLSALEEEKRGLLQALDARQTEAQSLRASNDDLNRRLEALMQRLELSASQTSLASGRQPANAETISAILPGADTLEIPQDNETDGRPVMQSAPTTPAQQGRPLRAPQGSTRRGPFRWLAGLIAPPPPSRPDYYLS